MDTQTNTASPQVAHTEPAELTVTEIPQGVVVQGLPHFTVEEVLECGQVFRWRKDADTYLLFVGDKIVRLREKEDFLVFEGISLDEFEHFWRHYFDLDTDYAEIYSYLSKRGKKLKAALDFAPGIRILKQPHFETIVNFILSANNNIKRIQKSVFALSREYGEPLARVGGMSPVFLDANDAFAFPTPEALAATDEETLKLTCGVGYRAPYLIESARMIASGEVDLEALELLETEDLIEQLMRLKGVGKKVADCIALFSYGRVDVFPVDVWTKRVMETLYAKHELTEKQAAQEAYKRFGKYAGYAQQYLFYYGRVHDLGIKQ